MGCRVTLIHRVVAFILKHTKPETGSNSEAIEIAVDTTTLLLTVVRDASKFAPLPLVQNVAGLALSIITIVQGAHDNRGAFRSLAEDACNLAYAIVLQTRDSTDKDAESKISPELRVNLEQLTKTLKRIQDFATKKVKNNMLLRIVQSASDFRVIQDYRTALRQSLDLFGLKSSITIQENLAALSAQQDALHKDVQEHLNKAQGITVGSWEGQDTAMISPHIESSNAIVEITTIGKDQNTVDCSHHVTSTNCNNVSTVMTNTGPGLDGTHPTVMIPSTTNQDDSPVRYFPDNLERTSPVEMVSKLDGRERQDKPSIQKEPTHTALTRAAVHETLNKPFPTPSRNPFHYSYISKNPFAQSSSDFIFHNPQFHPHRKSTSEPLQSSTFRSPLQAMPTQNLQQSKHWPPNIPSSPGQFNITHIGGDQKFMDSSCHIMSSNSGNTSTTITTNSNNDSSTINIGIDEFPQSLLVRQHLLASKTGKRTIPFAYV